MEFTGGNALVSVQAKTKVVFLFTLLPYLIVYFAIQSCVTVSNYSLLTDFDKLIPFNSHFVWIYHTFLPVIITTLIFMIKKKELFFSAIVALSMATIILSIFYIFFPSFYPREDFIDNSTLSGFLLELTRKIDGAQNTFPSSHVTFSWLMVFFIGLTACAKKNKWIYIGYFIWASLVSISTLTIKQHYIIDVFSGIALAYLCYYFSKTIVFDRFAHSN